MSNFRFTEEIIEWNTPLILTYLLWKFTIGYEEASNGVSPVALFHFLAAAILTNDKLSHPISKRISGIESYVNGFRNRKETDILDRIHDIVLQKRETTFKALDIGISAGFIAWDTDNARIIPRKFNPRLKETKLDLYICKRGKAAMILGQWFAQSDLPTISTYLGVLF